MSSLTSLTAELYRLSFLSLASFEKLTSKVILRPDTAKFDLSTNLSVYLSFSVCVCFHFPDAGEHEGPEREGGSALRLARHRVPDDKHLEDAEHDPRRVTEQEDEDDPHEDDGQVVLLFPARLLRGRG